MYMITSQPGVALFQKYQEWHWFIGAKKITINQHTDGFNQLAVMAHEKILAMTNKKRCDLSVSGLNLSDQVIRPYQTLFLIKQNLKKNLKIPDDVATCTCKQTNRNTTTRTQGKKFQ